MNKQKDPNFKLTAIAKPRIRPSSTPNGLHVFSVSEAGRLPACATIKNCEDKRIWLSAVVVFACLCCATAQTNLVRTNISRGNVGQTNIATSANRYLMIVETSRSMGRRAEGNMKAAQQLLVSGMGGQLRR